MSCTTARCRSSAALLLVALTLVPELAGAVKEGSAPKALAPQPLPSASKEADQGPQVVQADRQGRVVLFRPVALEVIPVRPGGKLGEGVKLKSNAMDVPGPRAEAAMSGSGDWLVQQGPRVRLFRGGRETALEDSGWYLAGLGWLRDDPLISVEPARTVRGRMPKGPAPLVLRWSGKAWETLVAEDPPTPPDRALDPAARAFRSVKLLGDAKGNLWLASSYRYLVRRYSSAGKLKGTLAAGKEGVEVRQDSEKIQQRFAREVGKAGPATEKGAILQAETALPVIDALAEGRDGCLYLLVHQASESGDFALDRFDPVRAVLERVPLRLRNLGVMSLAGGKDGLYLATFSAQRGRWRIPWVDLDAANWRPVPQAKIDGLEPESSP